MKTINLMHLFTVCMYLILGIIIGVVIDKDWLSDQQMLYVQQLKDENILLVKEQKEWVRYVEDEINDMKIFTNAENEQFQDLKNIFAKMDVHIEGVSDTLGISKQSGIIISLGQELEETYGLPQLFLEKIPKHESDVTVMYLSLLRMKEELTQ